MRSPLGAVPVLTPAPPFRREDTMSKKIMQTCLERSGVWRHSAQSLAGGADVCCRMVEVVAWLR
jgi:hypothetical protein